MYKLSTHREFLFITFPECLLTERITNSKVLLLHLKLKCQMLFTEVIKQKVFAN